MQPGSDLDQGAHSSSHSRNPRGRISDPAHDLERRCLARSISTHERNGGSLSDFERDIVKCSHSVAWWLPYANQALGGASQVVAKSAVLARSAVVLGDIL